MNDSGSNLNSPDALTVVSSATSLESRAPIEGPGSVIGRYKLLEQVVARFEAERQALAVMDHPNIAKVFDAGATEAGRPYFVMELVRGIKITEYCDQNHLRVWERETLRETATFRGFLLGVHSVASAPDNKRLVAGSNWKEALKLWDLASRQELITLEAPSSYYYSTGFSPDGIVLASVNGQSVLHLWRAPSWADIEAAEKVRP